jgi:hypothetical protein
MTASFYEMSYRPRNESRYPDEVKCQRTYEKLFCSLPVDAGRLTTSTSHTHKIPVTFHNYRLHLSTPKTVTQ